MVYDLAIIGGGPAGVAAGVYAARKKLRTVFITKDWGGQSTVSPEVQNWIGFIKISGIELADALRKHLEAYAGDSVSIKGGEAAGKVEKAGGGFAVTTESGARYEARTVLVATGSHRRKLPAKNADRLEHRGITYCASCDGPLFSGKIVAVVGGGNAGFETAAQLLAYCPSVTMVLRGSDFRADPVTVEKVLAHPNMHMIKNAEITEVFGKEFVEGIHYKEKGNGTVKELAVEGIFVEIGSVPSTNFVAGLVERNQWNQIVTDPRTQKTSVRGIWAAGDATDTLYHQNNIAAGDAVRAIEDIYLFLHAGK